MEIDYHDRPHQVANKDIAIGTASRIFLAEHKDEVKGTAVERRYFSHVGVWDCGWKDDCQISVKWSNFGGLGLFWILAGVVLSHLQFLLLDSANVICLKILVGLMKWFNSFWHSVLHLLISCLHLILQKKLQNRSLLGSHVQCQCCNWPLDTCFWRIGKAWKLVLPHSNVDRKCVFSMVGKIETKSPSQLSPSTTIDLLTVKMNHIKPCYACTDTVRRKFIDAAKTATRRRLQNQ